MNGYSVVIPLKYDPGDGPYLMNKSLKKVINQNLKMLILTNPGERVMDPLYGVGVKSLLFYNRTDSLSQINLEELINNKIKRYMPFLTIDSIDVTDDIPNNLNAIFIKINYQIPSIKESDNISIILNR